MDDPSPSQEESRGKVSGWGLTGWGKSAFSVISTLQKAAVEAADDISKTALAVAKDTVKGVADLQHSVNESPKLDAEEISSDGKALEQSSAESEPDSPHAKLRHEALQKLEAAGEDSALGHGLKVVDSSVENLATGAWQAFGNAFKGGVSWIQKLEDSAENLAETFQKQGSFSYKPGVLAPTGLIEGGKALTAKGLEVLEYVGKEALDLIATEAGIELEEDSKQMEHDTADDEQFIDDVTFDRCFYIYGGPEQLEELEALSNHYMLLFNRAKAKMPSDEKSSFELLFKQLQQIMDLTKDSAGKVLETDKGKGLDTGLQADLDELKVLRETSIVKAAEMAAGFSVTLGGLAITEVVQRTLDRLEAIRVEGVYRVSELCASNISQLLNLGKSVLKAGSPNEGDGHLSEVNWPEECVRKAEVIKAYAMAMTSDIEAVTDGFLTGISDVTTAFQVALKMESVRENDQCNTLLKEKSVGEKARVLTADLENDGSNALEKIHSGLRQLIYVVLSTSLKN